MYVGNIVLKCFVAGRAGHDAIVTKWRAEQIPKLMGRDQTMDAGRWEVIIANRHRHAHRQECGSGRVSRCTGDRALSWGRERRAQRGDEK